MNEQLDRVVNIESWHWRQRWQSIDIARIVERRVRKDQRHCNGPILWKCVVDSLYSEQGSNVSLLSQWLEAKLGVQESTGMNVRKIPPTQRGGFGGAICLRSLKNFSKPDFPQCLAGTSAAIVLFGSENDRSRNRDRLRTLSRSLPKGAKASLIVLAMPNLACSGSHTQDRAAKERTLLEEMRQDLAESLREERVGSYRLLILPDSDELDAVDASATLLGLVAWEEIQDQLQDCLDWLAERMPPAPQEKTAYPREILDAFLEQAVTKLMSNMDNASPAECVSEINAAISASAQCARSLSSLDPAVWPPDELRSQVRKKS